MVPPGTVTSEDAVVLGATSGSPTALRTHLGKTAVGTAVRVQSVPADEGFWVGTSATNRVWVQLIGAGESPYTIKAGDTLAFSGKVTAHDGTFASQVGVDTTEGAPQLTTQAAHIAVAKTAVKVAD